MHKILVIAADSVMIVCALWAECFISLFLHEFGHALGYMISTGDKDWYIQVGQGKRLLDTKVLKVNLIVLDGFFAPEDNKIDSKAQLVITLSGGPIVTLLLLIGLLVLKFGGISHSFGVISSGLMNCFFYMALIINFFILLWAVLPAQWIFGETSERETDGMQIMNALKGHEE